ncbi:MAG: phosphoribosylformylglycinamidine synthase subunit PurQ [Deltaproteobacteria bacterium]
MTGNGTNCEVETRHACLLAGADVADIVHISSLIHGEVRLDDYHFLNLPGGFLDGDDLGSAKAAANRILHIRIKGSNELLIDQFIRFISDGKLIIGICNGFQLLVKIGFLPAFDNTYQQKATLTFNDSGKFEARWVYLKTNENSPCIFTKGITGIYLPIRHGEGQFVTEDDKILKQITQQNLVALSYSDANFEQATEVYPLNPNGSAHGIAGICNPSGRIFGLMPHPEAYLHFTNHPRWTRERKSLPSDGMGLSIFRNAIDFIRKSVC